MINVSDWDYILVGATPKQDFIRVQLDFLGDETFDAERHSLDFTVDDAQYLRDELDRVISLIQSRQAAQQ